MIRELVGSYLNLNGRSRTGNEPPRNEERLAAPIPADIIREGIERLAEEKGTSAEEVVDAAAAEAVGGQEDKTLEQELAYGDYAEKIQSMYPECKSGSSRNLSQIFYTAFRAGNLPHKVAHNRPHDARLAHLYFKVGGDRHQNGGDFSSDRRGLPDVRVTAGNLRIFYENMPEEPEVCLKLNFDVKVAPLILLFLSSWTLLTERWMKRRSCQI